MAGVDFSDREAAEKWLEEQSVEMRCAIASRAALRILANICELDTADREVLALAIFRAILISTLFDNPGATRPDRDHAIDAAYAAADFAANSAANSAGDAAADAAAGEIYLAAINSAHSAAYSAPAITNARLDARSAVNKAISWDTKQEWDLLNSRKLWSGAVAPAEIERNHATFLIFLNKNSAWSFWRRFYLRMWKGNFNEWDLAREVAQIPSTEWEKGHVHIGALIAEIEARLKTDRAVDDLRLCPIDRFGIGGNNPPPEAEMEIALSQVHEGARLIRQQVDSREPDQTQVQRGVSLLASGLTAILKWIGAKGDLAVDQLIKWGVPAGCVHLVMEPQKIQALIDAAKAWLPLI